MRNSITTKIIGIAESEARNRKSPYITVEDLVIGCLSIIASKFKELSPNLEKINENIRNYLKRSGQFPTDKAPKLTADAAELIYEMDDNPIAATTGRLLANIARKIDPDKSVGSRVAHGVLNSMPKQVLELNQLEQVNNLRECGVDVVEAKALTKDQLEAMDLPKANYGSGSSENEEQSFLEAFGNDLSVKERRNPLIGREKEIDRIYEVLLKKDKPNPILTGAPGVGKTAVVEEIAIRIREGKVPLAIRNEAKRIVSIQMATLLSGSAFRGEFEKKLQGILDEVKASNHETILFIDEIHTIMKAGSGVENPLDAANILKPYLTDGSIRIIGSTTEQEYRKFIESDKALERRFMPVSICEPSVDDTIKIINGIKSGYEKYHDVKYTDDAVKAAVELSVMHIHDRFLPDKAVDLIDEAGAINKAKRYDEGEKLDNTIGTDQIEDVLFNVFKIPKTQMTDDESENVRTLADNLKNAIFGQDDAVNAIIKSVKMSKAGIRDKNKPIAALLFVGPTGTGKTELSKQTAESLGYDFLRLDMSEYQEEHTVAKLFGSPAGYVGYEDGGILTNAVRSKPNCVLLLDEIEKAHPKIFNAFLQVLDYGFMTDSKGVKVDFRNTVIIMTSNAGATKVVKKNLGFGGSNETVDTGAMDEALKSLFPPEFRGRLTDVIKFNDITPEVSELIVKKEIKSLTEKLLEKNVKLSVTDGCIKHIAETGYTPMTGARNIKNLVVDDISQLLVDDILFGKLKNGGSARVDWDGAYKKRIRAK